ncbi:MAG: PQQ-binding-like beta-propeller repeat protein [Planctomycetaceae bacterium]
MFRLSTVLTVLAACCVAEAADFPRGWRGDGSGRFAATQPPVVWSATKNVLWRLKMPARSNSQPIIVGNRVFTCAEPNTLMCVDKNSGKLLWSRTNGYRDIVPAAQWSKVQTELQQARKIQAEKRKDELALRSIERRLEVADGKGDKPAVKRLASEAKAVGRRIAGRDAALKRLPLAMKWRTHPTHDRMNGYTTATPTSDGRHVWGVFGNAVVCCYDLDGNRKWVRKMSDSPHSMFGHSASPLLIGGRLIVNIEDTVALNKSTGEELWRAGYGQCWGSTVHVRVGKQDFIAVPNGRILRASDGKRAARARWVLSDASPIFHDGVLYYVQNRGGAVKLPKTPAEKLELTRLWNTDPKGSRYFSSPVLHDGLLYTVSSRQIMTVIDAADGKVVYQRRLNAGRGTAYPSVCFAGGRIYVSSDNGTTVVLKPGRKYEEIARNKLDGFISTPVFDGNRMYLRTHRYLYCIGK